MNCLEKKERTDRGTGLQTLTLSGLIPDTCRESSGLGLEGDSVEKKEQETRNKKSSLNLLAICRREKGNCCFFAATCSGLCLCSIISLLRVAVELSSRMPFSSHGLLPGSKLEYFPLFLICGNSCPAVTACTVCHYSSLASLLVWCREFLLCTVTIDMRFNYCNIVKLFQFPNNSQILVAILIAY